MQLILSEQRDKYITLPNKLNSMNKKNKPYKIEHHIDTTECECIAEYLIAEVEDGNMNWKEAIKQAAFEAIAVEWFQTRFTYDDCIAVEYDSEAGIVVWDMQKDYIKR